MSLDRRGRCRKPDQERGLRPLYPLLPPEWTSRVLRVAMSGEDWARFDALVRESSAQAVTQARAHGRAISTLIREGLRPTPRPTHWMDWERQKTIRLLGPSN